MANQANNSGRWWEVVVKGLGTPRAVYAWAVDADAALHVVRAVFHARDGQGTVVSRLKFGPACEVCQERAIERVVSATVLVAEVKL